MKILIFLVHFLCLSVSSTAQSNSIKKIDTFYLISLQEKQRLADTKIEQLNKELQKIETSTNENLKSYKDDIKLLLNIYLSIVLGSIGVIGFAINFFGKSAIKQRVESIIREIAQSHTENKIVQTLNSTLTNELIEKIIKQKSQEELTLILKNIELQGTHVINEFKNKGDEIIKSMLAAPPINIIKEDIHDPKKNQTALESESIQANELFNLAFNSTDSKLQISLYKSVLDLQPTNVSALNNLAAAYNLLNETTTAIEILNKAIQLNNSYFLAFSNRGNSYYLQNDLEKAFEDVNTAISLKKDFYFPYSIKSLIYKKQNNLLQAENILKEAIEQNPLSAEANFTLGFFYEGQQKFDKSLQYYETAKQLDFPNLSMLFNNMAVLFRRQKQFDTALEYLEKARQVNPNFPNLDGTMALIYADKNETEKFYYHLKIALEKGCPVWNYLDDPGFSTYRNSKRLKMLIKPFKQRFYS